MSTTAAQPHWRTPAVVLVCGGIIITLAMGIRHGFGLFLQPMSADLHFGRETFALAMAVQNLTWGATQPFAGMLADKYGTGRVAASGALLYAVGLACMSYASTPTTLILSAGLLVGIGLSGVTFSVIAGVLGRAYPPEKRSMVLGISAAAGSFGQFAVLPLTQWLLGSVGWHSALLILSCLGLFMIPLAVALVERRASHAHAFAQSAAQAMQEALSHKGYMLLTIGFFVCGFQVVFIGVHLPAYLADRGLAPHVAVTALALIGLFNIIGTYSAGWLGSRVPKRYILTTIYFGRSVVIAVRVRVRDGDGPAVALHRAADQQPRRAAVRRALPRDARRVYVLQPPDRQLPGRVAGRPAVRPDGKLRRRVDAVHRARHRRRPAQPADRRDRGQAAGGERGLIFGRRQRGSGGAGGSESAPIRSMASVMIPSTPQPASSATRAASFTVQASTR